MHRELYDIYVTGDVVVVSSHCRVPTTGRSGSRSACCLRPASAWTRPAAMCSGSPNGKLQRFDCYPEGSVILSQLGVLGNLGAVVQPHVTV